MMPDLPAVAVMIPSSRRIATARTTAGLATIDSAEAGRSAAPRAADRRPEPSRAIAP